LRGGRGTFFVPSTPPTPNLPCGCEFFFYLHNLLTLCNFRRSYYLLANCLLAYKQCWSISNRVHRGDNNQLIYLNFPLLTHCGARKVIPLTRNPTFLIPIYTLGSGSSFSFLTYGAIVTFFLLPPKVLNGCPPKLSIHPFPHPLEYHLTEFHWD